uniref:G-2 and S-phase expressed 1 n=1 Tax=Nothobranchius furzeri TaxID=105023 RepID=A0A1A8AAE1_NOTFU
MDCGANRDVLLLQDEEFDFDVTLSPDSTKGDDDDEVFVDPVSHAERCASVNVESELEEYGAWANWTPLTGDQLEVVCQEAHRLASQLQNGEPHSGHTEAAIIKSNTAPGREEFVQDAEAKVGLLGQSARVLSPVKRETFCVQDSPMKQLPPAIQRHLLRGSISTTAPSTRPATRLSTSSPLVRSRAQPHTSLRGKASLGVAVVLPSKPLIPPTSSSASKNKVERMTLQPPSKVEKFLFHTCLLIKSERRDDLVDCTCLVLYLLSQVAGVLRRSPSTRSINRADSSEDLLSDSMSVASDISDSSINSSLLGKRTLAPPTKSIRARDFSGVKALPCQSRRMSDVRKSSSSSSSVSSFNSSMSLSPAKGKPNSSLNRNRSTPAGHTPSSMSGASQNRARHSTAYAAAEPTSSGASRRSLSAQVKSLSEAERARAVKFTPVKRARIAPSQPTPPRRLASTGSSRLQNGVKSKPKSEALAPPMPQAAGKALCTADDGSKVLKSKRLSTCSTESLHVKQSAGSLTPSVGSCKSVLVATQRPSALPTPAKCRASAIPAPSSQARAVRSRSNITPTPTSAGRQRSCSPILKDSEEEEFINPPEIKPFCLEEEEVVPIPPSNTEEPIQTENTDVRVSTDTKPAPTRDLMDLETTEESATKTQEVLLLDLTPPSLQPQEKLLIDLTNTPELVCRNEKSGTTTQLIDLSSPLIKWSPDEKKENSAPLINLSF